MKDEMLALLVADLHVNNTVWIKLHCLHFSKLINDANAIQCNKMQTPRFVIVAFVKNFVKDYLAKLSKNIKLS